MIYILIAVTGFLSVPVCVLFIEVAASCLYRKDRNESTLNRAKESVSYRVLIPAHNEEPIISATLSSLLSKGVDPVNVVVIADNCTDDTAIRARAKGVTVVERADTEMRGKGYAIAYGIKSLENAPPEVIIIIDADCEIHSGELKDLAEKAVETSSAIQCTYLIEDSENSTFKSRIAALAILFKNHIRPLGLKEISGPCLLTGAGMALPWSLVKSMDFATGNIVEDMHIGLECARSNGGPLYYQEVVVKSILPSASAAQNSQRRRWEHGHLRSLIDNVPCLLRDAVVKKDIRLLLLALELGVPPLSLLVLTQVFWTLTSVAIALMEGECEVAGLFFLPSIFLLCAIMLGWYVYGKNVMPLRFFLVIPIYVIVKIPLYVGFLIRPEKRWIRTSRE